MKLAVLVACYNRINVTLIGLRSLCAGVSTVPALNYQVFLVDDASPDETGRRVSEEFPDVIVIEGTGQLYWNGGMCKAYAIARTYGSFDAYLLYNDDVEVIPERVRAFIETFIDLNRGGEAILVGPTISKESGQISYGGFRQTSKYRALSFHRVPITGNLEPVDTFNGNWALVPGGFFERTGGPDPAYVQDYADLDLGLLAARRGVRSYVWSEPIGFCEPDMRVRTRSKKWVERIRTQFGGTSSLREYLHFVAKNRPRWLFPAYAIQSVLRRLLASI